MNQQLSSMPYSVISFNQYINSIKISKDNQLVDGWGWYVDIEKYTNKIPIQPTKYNKYGQLSLNKMSSHKSIANLNEFCSYDKISNTLLLNQLFMIYFNLFCIFGLVTVYCMLF
jgi:hypothetical protein